MWCVLHPSQQGATKSNGLNWGGDTLVSLKWANRSINKLGLHSDKQGRRTVVPPLE